MNFLLDTDTCSFWMRQPRLLAPRFIQHAGGLCISTVVLAELLAGAYMHPNTVKYLGLIQQLLAEVSLLEFDRASAEHFGQTRGVLLKHGLAVSRMDLMIAAVALAHDLTLVTHNLQDYQLIPGLRAMDWLGP